MEGFCLEFDLVDWSYSSQAGVSLVSVCAYIVSRREIESERVRE